jgi:SAM-dependent methyltransferase
VIGVDDSEAMLSVARSKVPDADFRPGELTSLPVGTSSVDLVVCSLALTHQPALGPVLREFARVLRPGGRLITSDIHWLSLYLGGITHVPDGQGRWGRMPASRFLPSDYLRAALEEGYAPLSCEEVPWPDLAGGHGGPLAQAWCPDAARKAYVGLPAVLVWHLEVGRRRVSRAPRL